MTLSGVQSALTLDDGLARGSAAAVLSANASNGVPVAHFERECSEARGIRVSVMVMVRVVVRVKGGREVAFRSCEWNVWLRRRDVLSARNLYR